MECLSIITLLGFDIEESRQKYSLPCNIDGATLFSRPNPKTFEVILHFLLEKYDKSESSKRFVHCWPIYDRIQARDFRNIVFKWVEEMKKEGKFPASVPVRRSYLDECKGERFETFVLTLSRCCLEKCLMTEFSDCKIPTLEMILSKNFNLTEKFLDDYIKFYRLKTIKSMQDRGMMQESWRKSAEDLSNRFRDAIERKKKLSKDIQLFKASLDDQSSILASVADNELQMEQFVLEKMKQFQRVMRLWSKILDFEDKFYTQKDAIDLLIEKGKNNSADLFINGDLVDLEPLKEIILSSGNSTLALSKGGKINLVALIETWNLFVEDVSMKIEMNSESNQKGLLKLSQMQNEHSTTFLDAIKSTKTQLEHLILQVENIIHELQQKLEIPKVGKHSIINIVPATPNIKMPNHEKFHQLDQSTRKSINLLEKMFQKRQRDPLDLIKSIQGKVNPAFDKYHRSKIDPKFMAEEAYNSRENSTRNNSPSLEFTRPLRSRPASSLSKTPLSSIKTKMANKMNIPLNEDWTKMKGNFSPNKVKAKGFLDSDGENNRASPIFDNHSDSTFFDISHETMPWQQ